MKDLKIKKFITGEIQTNVYLIYNEATKKAFLVDCAGLVDEYVQFIKENQLDVAFVVLTHGHYDHIDGLNEFLLEFDVPFYISEKEQHMLINPMDNGSLMMGESVVINKKAEFVEDGQKIKFEDNELKLFLDTGK